MLGGVQASTIWATPGVAVRAVGGPGGITATVAVASLEATEEARGLTALTV